MNNKQILGIILLVVGIGLVLYFGSDYIELTDYSKLPDYISRERWESMARPQMNRDIIFVIFGSIVGAGGLYLFVTGKRKDEKQPS